MTMFNPAHSLALALKGWDDVRPTSECLHCVDHPGLAPGDGLTECGFCDDPTVIAASTLSPSALFQAANEARALNAS